MASALTKDPNEEASGLHMAPGMEAVQQGAQLTISTWNINGLRKLDPTTYNKSGQAQLTLAEQLKQLGASIICFQETKISRNDLTEGLAVPKGWSAYFSFSQVMHSAGYSGTATYVKQCEVGTLAAVEGLKGCCGFRRTAEGIFVSQEGCRFSCKSFIEQWESAMLRESEAMPEALMDELDREGRIVMTDHGPFVLVNVYVPASREGRGDFKMLFHRALKLRCEAMAAEGREVVLVGDLNAAAARIDHCEPGDDFDTRFTARWMQSLLTPAAPAVAPLFVDSFRCLHPNQASAFTCWNTVTGARKLNYGARIDYILVTPGLASRLASSCIRPDIEGSDHCPCFATFSSPPGLVQYDPTAPPVPISGESVLRAKGKQSKLHAYLNRPSTNGGTQAGQPDGASQSLPPAPPSPSPPSHPPSQTSNKRAKTGGAAQTGQQQRRLDHFFAKRSPTPPDTPERGGAGDNPPSQPQSQAQSQDDFGDWFSGVASTSGSVSEGMGLVTSASSATAGIATAAPVKTSSDQWKALFRPRSPVKCRCGEAAVERTVLKDGPNMGRKFYVCNRPEGPANDPRSRCDFFSWKTAYLGQDKKPAAMKGGGAKRKMATKK